MILSDALTLPISNLQTHSKWWRHKLGYTRNI